MKLKIVHFYPDLMSLYGSYANVAVLKRCLETLSNQVEIVTVVLGEEVSLADADFIFMGAGTERAQKAALRDFARYGDAVKANLRKGARRLAGIEKWPNPELGYGVLDLINSIPL